MSGEQPRDPTSEPAGAAPGAGPAPGLSLLWSYARPHLGKLGLGALLGLLATAVTLATPLAAKWVLDSLGKRLDLAAPVAILLALLVAGTIAGLAQTVLLGRLAEHIVLDARRSLIQRFIRAKLEQVQRFRTGELVTRVTSDTVLLREAATTSIVQLINGTVSLVGTVVLMAVLDWPLLATTLVALLVIGSVFGLLVPQIGKADKRAQDAIGELGAGLEGGMRALRTVKSSRAETREIGRVTAKAEESARHAIRSVWFSALVWTVAGGGMQLAIIVILGIGAARVSLGDLAVSTLVAFLLYAFKHHRPDRLAGGCVRLDPIGARGRGPDPRDGAPRSRGDLASACVAGIARSGHAGPGSWCSDPRAARRDRGVRGGGSAGAHRY